MTSAAFDVIPLDSIYIDRDNRQRKELTGIEELAASIARIGLINPIVVDGDLNLIAGERRYTACKSLGFDQIAVQYAADLDPTTRHLIELEENIKREALTWTDHVEAVSEYHRLRQEQESDWTAAKTGEELGMSSVHIGRFLLVDSMMEHELVKNADKLSVAFNAAQRIKERKQANETDKLDAILDQALGQASGKNAESGTVGGSQEFDGEAGLSGTTDPGGEGAGTDFDGTSQTPHSGGLSEPSHVIHHRNFLTYLDNLKSSPLVRPFNFIHCDFPYGVGVGDKSGQSSRDKTGSYADTPDIYFELLEAFTASTDLLVAPSAHLMFWFSMNFYTETYKALSAGGWQVSPYPLVWHKSDNAGIIPDPNRGPRRTYETAFLASRGDRKIVKPRANSYSGPTTRETHTSEKPLAMLEHFFSMLVDEHTLILDPTAGSGNSIIAARALKAERGLGLELDPDFAAKAQERLLDKA